MDKKNTMLLTVIAVATLLVAVVGATFAYFSIQTGETSNTTTVNGQVASAGVVTGTKGAGNVSINLSNTDMALANDGKYYATTDGSLSKDAVVNHDVFTATLENAAAGETYTCKFNLEVTVSGNGKLAAGDANLYLTGVGDTDFDGNHDLVSTFNGITKKEITWTFTSDGSKTISLNAYIENKADTEQNDTLANLDLKVKTNVTDFTCSVSKNS